MNGAKMTDTSNIDRLCKEWGVDTNGPQKIRNFIESAFFHAALPATPRADQFLAICTSIRTVSVRIACRWIQPARAEDHCLNLSREAVRLRDEALERSKETGDSPYLAWRRGITVEHQEPVSQIAKELMEAQPWRDAERRDVAVNGTVLRLLNYPIALISKHEDRQINALGFRMKGAPSERYTAAGIILEKQSEGTLKFFTSRSHKKLRTRRSKWADDIEF